MEKSNYAESNRSPRAQEKGWRSLVDDDGNFIYSVKEFNGTLHSAYDSNFVEIMEGHMKSFPVNDDDIYLLAYPKSGTHWLWEILMMLTRGSAVIRDEHKAEAMLERRERLLDIDRPRIINTHMNFENMPPDILRSKSVKFIQILRNPADVAVSYYYQLKARSKDCVLTYGWNDYISKIFCNEKLMMNGTWFYYVTSWLQHSGQENFLTVFYEDLHEKPQEVIGQIAEFLNISLDNKLMEEIIANTSLHKMKAVKHDKEARHIDMSYLAGFSMYRKGIIGDWRNHFTPEQHKQFMSYFNEKLEGRPELQEKYQKYLEL